MKSSISPHIAKGIYQRTRKGQAHVAETGLPASLSPAQRSALLLFNGFTPVQDLFKPVHVNEPIDTVVKQLLVLELIRPTEPVVLQKKWFGPTVAALATSTRSGQTCSSE